MQLAWVEPRAIADPCRRPFPFCRPAAVRHFRCEYGLYGLLLYGFSFFDGIESLVKPLLCLNKCIRLNV